MFEPQNLEGSVLVAKIPEQRQVKKYGKAEISKVEGQESKKDLWCTYYRNTRHTKDKCWKLYGRNKDRKERWGQTRSINYANFTVNQTSQEGDPRLNELSKEEVERLQKLLGNEEKNIQDQDSGRKIGPILHNKTSDGEKNGHLLATARALLSIKMFQKIIWEKPY